MINSIKRKYKLYRNANKAHVCITTKYQQSASISFTEVGEKGGYDAEQGHEGTPVVDGLNAVFIGEVTQDC